MLTGMYNGLLRLCYVGAKTLGCVVICSLVNGAESNPAESSGALQCSGYMVNIIFREMVLVRPA